MPTIHIGGEAASTRIVTADRVRAEFTGRPKRFYRHGWQSWSLAAWVDPSIPMPVPLPQILHPMQIDPLWAFHPRLNGSWVGAVETENAQVVLAGSLGLDAHVELEEGALVGWYESGSGEWFIAQGDEAQVFAAYALELRKRLGGAAHGPPGGVWCSWYSFHTHIDEQALNCVFDALSGLPFEVVQVDDGWQRSVGDWEANERFPSGMRSLAGRIRSTDRRAGLWLAPLIAVRSSGLFHEHPDWFLRDSHGTLVSAGYNWGQQLHALDTTIPAVEEWLASLMRRVRGWGFDYLKLDFLYGSALPGERHRPLAREAALRQALQVMREAMGPEAFLVACGVPILPCIGMCDALRIGPDVSSHWSSVSDERLLQNPAIPGGRNAVRTSVNRLWLAPLAVLDPDVVYFRTLECRLSSEQKRLLQALAHICGFRATSDSPQWLSADEREQLADFLGCAPRVERLGPRRFRIDGVVLDYAEVSQVSPHNGSLSSTVGALLGWLANHRSVLKIYEWLRHVASARRLRRLRQGL